MALTEDEELELLELEEEEYQASLKRRDLLPARVSEMTSKASEPLALPILRDPVSNLLRRGGETVGKSVESVTGMGEWGGKIAENPRILPGMPRTKAGIATAVDMLAEPLPYSLTPDAMAAAVGSSFMGGMRGASPTFVRPTVKYGLSKITGISRKTLDRLEKNPRLADAATLEQIASSDVPRIASKFETIRSGLSEQARKTISTSPYLEEGAVPKDLVLKQIEAARKDLGGVYTPEGRTAARSLSKISEDFNKFRNTVSQNSIYDTIRKIDNEIPWDRVWKSPENLTATDKAMIGIRGRLDSLLKSSNKKYADIMKPLSEAIQSRNEFLKKMGMESIRGEKGRMFVPGDMTVNRLANIAKEGKLGTERVMSGVERTTGEDLLPRIEDALARRELEQATMNIPMTKIGFSAAPLAKGAMSVFRPRRLPLPSVEFK